MPLMFIWLGAHLVIKLRQMHEDAGRLKASIETLRNAVSMNSPASSAEVVQAINETTASAMRAEQSRITTQFRNMSVQQTKIEEALRTLLKARGEDQQAINQLVETAQDVAQQAETAEQRESKLSKMTFEAVHSSEDQDALPFETQEVASDANIDWSDLIRREPDGPSSSSRVFREPLTDHQRM